MRQFSRFLLPLAALAALFLSSPAASAEEATLLERLSRETTELADRAHRATARVSAGATRSEAIVVGSPPRLVTTFESIGAHRKIRFVLFNGTSGQARRIAAEQELDIAVYELPENAARAVEALRAEPRWDLPAGRVAVLAGRAPRLLLTTTTSGPRDGVRLADDQATGVLLSADGSLLGFRPPVAQPPGHFQLRGFSYVSGHYDVVVLPSESDELPRVALDFPLDFGRDLVAIQGPPVGSVLTPKTLLPGALIHRVLEDLDDYGAVRRAYLGVVPAAPKTGSGTRLVTVLEGSPAAKAGLREGDVIIAIDGAPVLDVATFTRQLVLRRAGETVTFLVGGRAPAVRVELVAEAEARRALPTPRELGFDVLPLTAELRAWLGVKEEDQGVVVTSVTPNTPAAVANLKRGDVIVEGGGQPTRDPEELRAALAGADGRITLKVIRVSPDRHHRLLLSLRMAPRREGSPPSQPR